MVIYAEKTRGNETSAKKGTVNRVEHVIDMKTKRREG